MRDAILETKLFAPRRRQGLVSRPRLTERLSRGDQSRITLISAPAGFGKTTLITQWLAARGEEWSPSWLSLDAGDNDPVAFWSYVIAALQAASPGVGERARSLLDTPPASIEDVLTKLLNDLSTLQTDVVLVLDDYHEIVATEIHRGMEFLVDHLPPRVYLVIATRADPGLPLARLRARGELAEIRAADLRFTTDEAASYLGGTMGLNLTDQEVQALERRTEGWIAALQLAGLSMQGRDDLAGFIAGFTGDDRYIVDYLVEEVLQRQPEDLRRFLLDTSILSRMTGPLCDAVTGRDDSRATLDALDRANLLLVPLDERRRWYRYHHLFADMLRARLLDEQPARVHELHRRASDWYEQNHERAEAIRHAMAGEDLDRAADLVELAIPAMRQGRQEVALIGWVRALPDESVRRRPVLSVGYAWALLASGGFEDAEGRLQDAERWLGGAGHLPERPERGPVEMVVVDHEEFRLLAATIAIYRAVLAQFRGDLPATVRHARQVLDLAPEDDDLRRGAAAALLGLASWATGDLETAHRIYAEGMARVQRAGNLSDAIGAAIALADIRIAQGRLRDALHTYEQALQLATGPASPALRAAADLHVGMSDVLREQGESHAAMEHLLTSKELGEHNGFPQNRYRWYVVTARIRESVGDLDGALEALREAERLHMPDFNPDVHPLSALVARVWVRQGRLGDAIGWARQQSLSAEDDLSYLREFEHITLARVLLARPVRDEADRSMQQGLDLLERLLKAAEDGARRGSVIEILVLQALGHHAQGDVRGALVPLERALALAEPEGYVRIFVDEGAPMRAVLGAAAERRMAPTYVRRLRAALGHAAPRTAANQALPEPLSERELDVLRLLGTDLDGPDIARELVVSINTVRSHTKNIYAKLGVNDRRAAVRRGAELDLLRKAATADAGLAPAVDA